MALAWAVAPLGKVYTYEIRPDTYQLARRNLERVGLLPYVEMSMGSIDDGFRQKGMDALFLDVRAPWEFLDARVGRSSREASLPVWCRRPIRSAICSMAWTCMALATLLWKNYCCVPISLSQIGLRPDDNMNGHTGFLVFARCMPPGIDMERWQGKERQRYRARKKMEQEIAEDAALRAADASTDERKYPKLPLP